MSKPLGAHSLQQLPSEGRRFADERRVRLDDAGPNGLLRLDAIARFLQDVATDDYLDAGFEEGRAWVLRRALISVSRPARFNESLRLTTWCSGFGSRYAERSTQIRGNSGARIDSAALWIYLDNKTWVPKRLDPEFLAIFGPSTGDRRIGATLSHSEAPGDCLRKSWTPLYCDMDIWNHVNNSRYWAVVVEEAADEGLITYRAEIEHRSPLNAGKEVEILISKSKSGLKTWFKSQGDLCASANVEYVEVAGLENEQSTISALDAI